MPEQLPPCPECGYGSFTSSRKHKTNCSLCYAKYKDYCKINSKRHWEKNKERITQQRQSWSPERKAANAEYLREWNSKNSDRVKAGKEKYNEKHRDRIKAQRLEYREQNKDKINARMKDYYDQNRERILDYHKTYRNEMMPTYYKLWDGIKQRCFNPNSPHYRLCGSRGITLYPSWSKSYGEFAAYMDEHLGPKPSKDHSLDRYPDRNGNYEPGNIRWATRFEQANNTRNNVAYKTTIPENSPIYYPDNNLTTLKEFAEQVKLPMIVAKVRYARNWDPEWILSKNQDGRLYQYKEHWYNIVELSLISGLSGTVVESRIRRGWSVEKTVETELRQQ